MATPFSLQTRDLYLAKAKRDAILKAADGRALDRVLGRENRNVAKCGDLITAYLKTPTVRANAVTRRRNVADLARMVRAVKGETFDVEGMSSSELTWQLVNTWQTQKLALAARECGSDKAALEAKKRSLNSLLTHIQSLFSAEARVAYRELRLPEKIDEFAQALPIPARKQEEPKQLSDEFVAELLQAVSIGTAEMPALHMLDPGAWAAFELMIWGGLRNKECFHARKSWLERIPAGFRLSMKPDGDFLPKGNSRAVIIPASIGEALLEQLKPGEDYLVPGRTMSDRHDACYRRLNDWLKSRGVTGDADKIAYRLRKYFLAKVAEQQGVMLAQVAAGHSSMQTTEDSYIGKPKMASPIRLAGTK